MNPKVKEIVIDVAAQKSYTLSPAAFRELHKYDLKWKPLLKSRWNTPLIQVALADKAIEKAGEEGRNIVTVNHVRKAILHWHPTGDPTECFGAGIRIMEEVQNKGITVVSPEFGPFLKKNLAG